VLALAACREPPEQQVLRAAGFHGPVTCTVVRGIDRTRMCGLHLTEAQSDSLERRLGLRLLDVPSRLGRVTNILELPFECQLLLFDNPRPMVFTGVFDAPHALFAPKQAVQFSSIVMARAYTGEACLTYTLDFN
jgi:hypothetical protein